MATCLMAFQLPFRPAHEMEAIMKSKAEALKLVHNS